MGRKENVEFGTQFFRNSRINYSIASIYYQQGTTNHSNESLRKMKYNQILLRKYEGYIKGVIQTIHDWVSKKYRQLYLAYIYF